MASRLVPCYVASMNANLFRTLQFLVIVLTVPSFATAQEATERTTVTFEVTDGHGSVIPNARAEIVSVADADAKTLVTGTTGTVELALEPGSYDVIVSASGFKTLNRQFVVKSGANQKFEIALRVGGCPIPDPCPVVAEAPKQKDILTAMIVVSDPSGGVIPDVQIKLLPAAAKELNNGKTDETGRLWVDLVPGDYQLFAANPLFLPSADNIQVQAIPNQIFRAVLQLPEVTKTIYTPKQGLMPTNPVLPPPPVASASITIVVTDPNGVAVPFAQIGGVERESDKAWKFPEADADGQYYVKLIPGSYDLAVTSPGFSRWSKQIQLEGSESRRVRVLLKKADLSAKSNPVGF